MIRAAASSMASGSPSSRRQIAATAGGIVRRQREVRLGRRRPLRRRGATAGDLRQLLERAAGDPRPAAARAATRELALAAQAQRRPAGGQDRQADRPPAARRLAARAASTCSQLSSTSSSRFGAQERRRASRAAAGRRPPAPRAWRRWSARPGRVAQRREIDEEDAIGIAVESLGRRSACASRVLPVPPGPVSVTSRTPSVQGAAARGYLPSRPMSGVGWTWQVRRDAAAASRSGGKSVREPGRDELEDPSGSMQIAQAVGAERAQADVRPGGAR